MDAHSSSMSVSSRTARSESANVQELGTFNGGLKAESRSSAEERKQRKREQDRMCQRRKREKDRENLRRLEARLNGLQTADESKTVLDLILRHEQDQAKIDRQVDRLRQLQSLLQAGLSELAKDGATTSTDLKAGESHPQDDADSVIGKPNDRSYPNMSMPTTLAGQSVTVPPPTTMFEMMPATSTIYGGSPSYGAFSAASAVSPTAAIVSPPGIGPSRNVSRLQGATAPWAVASQLVQEACERAPQSGGISTVDAIDQHVILTACLHGWDYAITALNLTHPLWQCLRQMDEAAVSTWKSVERMMGLWVVWLVMRASAQGGDALSQLKPKFLRPRPSQLNFPNRLKHIDYYPWPGVRERLVFQAEKYFGHETFLRVFSSSTCFVWPYGVADSFLEDKTTRMLQFSPEIIRRFNNINYWSVDSSFLNEFPEFRGDLPSYNSIPGHIDEKAAGDQEYYFQDEEDDIQVPVHPSWPYVGGNGFAGRNIHGMT